uniref:Uncharacterized protein n=1 Tax=uncultured bacterium contig00008 TaxID=1181500 RepID=A0A806JZA1_9BACT|nr:hypothetical protein [uncultured bacterium contig00008]
MSENIYLLRQNTPLSATGDRRQATGDRRQATGSNPQLYLGYH